MLAQGSKPAILVVDDEKSNRDAFERALRRDYRVVCAESAAAARQALDASQFDLMLCDIRMPGEDGISLLRDVRAKHSETACVMLTAYGSVETAVEAMKAGAADFLTKPVNLDQLDMVLERTLRAKSLESENRELRKRLDARYGLDGIIGSSPAMEALFNVIKQAAPTQATVLIQGASGTGKELVAQALHQLSTRSSGPFVAVHCAALSSTLLESELFGHEKGAFTGAIAQSKGRFEQASGGTLFLDEIGEIEPSVQVKLLRVLETRRFERVGGTQTLEADIRIVAATNRDLKAEVAAGRFREDLYWRLNVVDIHMPTLAERTGDIPILCDHFLKEFAKANGRDIRGFEPGAMSLLQAYSWPGNVRELRNTIEKMVVLARGTDLSAEDVPQNIRDALRPASPSGTQSTDSTVPVNAGASLAEIEKNNILAALERAGGNRSAAADALGISRRTLHRKLAAWGIAPRRRISQ